MSLQEGIQVGNAFMNFGSDVRRAHDQALQHEKFETEKQEKSAYNMSLEVLQGGDEAAITEYRKSPDFDHGQFLKAEADLVIQQSRNEGVKAQKYQNLKSEIEGTKAKLNDIGMKGFALWEANPRAAVEKLVSGWDLINSADSMKLSEDGKNIIITDNKTGEVVNTIPTPNKQGFIDLFSKVNSQEFDQNHIANRLKIQGLNAEAYKNPVPLINPETNEQIMLIETIDPRDGTYKPQYEKRDGTLLTKKEATEAGFVRKDEYLKDKEEKRKEAESAALVAERKAREKALTAEEQQRKNIQALIKSGKYTPESVKVYEKTMDVSDLVPAKKPEKDTTGKDKAAAEKEAHKVASDFIKEVADFGADAGHIPAYLETTNQRLHQLGQPGFVIEGENARRETAVEFTLSTMAEGEEKNIGGKLYVKRNGQLFEKRKKAGSGRGF